MGGKGSGCKPSPETAAKHNAWREYKAQGHTNKEVAERFGVSEDYVRSICKGIAPQGYNQFSNYDKLERNAAEWIRLKTPGLEYAGEYSGMDGPCKVRCRKCGAEFYRSFTTIRQGKARCSECYNAEVTKRKQAQAEAKAEKLLKAERERQERAEAKRRDRERREAERAARVHPCVICGTPTANKYCCSGACSRKRNDQIHEVRRRAKLVEAMVDKDITLEGVFRKDNGVCYLCGEPCDWNDKETTERGTFCGNTYPSIDHVTPLAKGGRHEWSNVRLAHRICNSKKSDDDPLGVIFS